MEPGWSGIRAGRNVQILAERTESIGGNYTSRPDNDTLCTGLRSRSPDFGKVLLQRRKPRRKLFPLLDVLKATSRQKRPPCARAFPASASVVSLSHVPPLPSHFPRKLRGGPQGEVHPGKEAKENHSLLYSNHRYLPDARSCARFWGCKNVRVLWQSF